MQDARGKLLVVEGLEGAGKSTAIAVVSDILEQHAIRYLSTREPGGTPIGESLRILIKNPEYKTVLDDRSELLLMYVARIQLLKEVVKPALEKGLWVLADRFEWSSFAYQGGGRGLDKQFLKQLSSFCLDGFRPDFTLYLDLSPELGLERAGQRGALDRIEAEPVDFFYRTQAVYLELLRSDAKAHRIDASRPLLEVQEAVTMALQRFLKEAGNVFQ